MNLAQQVDVPTVIFGTKAGTEIPGTIQCLEKPFQVIAALDSDGVAFILARTPGFRGLPRLPILP